MASDTSASIILPAYVPNEDLLEVTRRCLWSLHDTIKRYDHQLVIVENGSYWLDGTQSDANADVYLHYQEPLGYARAANIGLAVARHDWLIVVNTDIEFPGPWLERLREDYEQTPGGVLSAMDSLSKPQIVYDESWFSCWLTHRSVVQKVGYFDESMPFRFHDQDYAIRVKRAGYEVMRDGNVMVKHIDSATYDTMGHDPSKERQAMVDKWGAWCFDDWLSKQTVPA